MVNIAYIFYVIGWIIFIFFMVKSTLNVKEDLKKIEADKRNIGRN